MNIFENPSLWATIYNAMLKQDVGHYNNSRMEYKFCVDGRENVITIIEKTEMGATGQLLVPVTSMRTFCIYDLFFFTTMYTYIPDQNMKAGQFVNWLVKPDMFLYSRVKIHNDHSDETIEHIITMLLLQLGES